MGAAPYLLPDGTDDRGRPPQERFLARVIPEPMSGCWLWFGAADSEGYGRFTLNGKLLRPHRAAWLLFRGSIPDGLEVCHSCDNKGCANFEQHLFLGTHADNMADMARKGIGARGARNAHARLTPQQVDEIRLSDEEGAVLALRYGVHRQHIYAIRAGRFWKARPAA